MLGEAGVVYSNWTRVSLIMLSKRIVSLIIYNYNIYN